MTGDELAAMAIAGAAGIAAGTALTRRRP
jgi:LPXTG-motif cell wall-anchored protein